MHSLTRALSGALLLTIFAGCSSAAQQARQMAPTDVVATVGGAAVTLGEVDARALQVPASEFGSVRLVQALYLSRRVALEEIISSRLLDEEAKARNIDRATLLQREVIGRTSAPTEQDITFWYEAHPERVQGAPLDKVREPIKMLLTAERTNEARTAFVNTLKDKTAVTISLEPPRQTIATAGRPAKGPENAPIELVEFSDFQCPFCQRANPTKLASADLKAHAAAIGLDTTRFNTCLDTHETKTTVDEDGRDGVAAGVSGTPAFFINGRSLEGAQPFEAFKRIIDEELASQR